MTVRASLVSAVSRSTATAPAGVQVYNPAFDVTPARLIAGIVTERGVIRPVTDAAIRETLATPRA